MIGSGARIAVFRDVSEQERERADVFWVIRGGGSTHTRALATCSRHGRTASIHGERRRLRVCRYRLGIEIPEGEPSATVCTDGALVRGSQESCCGYAARCRYILMVGSCRVLQ